MVIIFFCLCFYYENAEMQVLVIYEIQNCILQEKALEALDKAESAESNDSESEEVQVDRDLATKEKEKVKEL